MSEFKKAALYVDLDSLLDTRAATLWRHDPRVLEQNLRGDYYTRTTDEFDGIDFTLYKALYAARDNETLKHGLATRVIPLILEFAKNTIQAIIESPFQRQPKVVINAYPYVLDDAAATWLIAGVKAATGGLLDVELVYKPLAVLTPEYVKQQYLFMVMYSYWEWLDAQAENGEWGRCRCPHVTLIGPQILKSKEAERQLRGIDVFAGVEQHASPFVKLLLYPVMQFSVDPARFAQKEA